MSAVVLDQSDATGTDSPYVLGYHVSNHDEANTTNGQVDVPF